MPSPPAETPSAAPVAAAHSATSSHSPAEAEPSSSLIAHPADQEPRKEEVPSTMREALTVFASHTTPRIIVAGIVSLLAWRASMPFCLADLAVCGCVALFWIAQEYFLHAKALHSDVAWFGRDIHLEHHMKPFYHVSLDGPDLVMGMMAASIALFWILFSGRPQAITATATYYTCGLMYEYTHYIVHTRVVPSTAWARCVRDNHVKHHMRNEDYWFAFTSPVLDSWFGTAPHPSAVKVSELAKQTRGV